MKKILFSLALLASQICFANDTTYKTSTGAVFKQIYSPTFGQSWKDQDGMIWSSSIGKYRNIPQSPINEGDITDSDAAKACHALGGSLPTLNDYVRLASYFDRAADGVLITDLGRKDLFALFPDLQGKSFWSSTVDAKGTIFYLFYDHGAINCWMDSCKQMPAAVRCVTR